MCAFNGVPFDQFAIETRRRHGDNDSQTSLLEVISMFFVCVFVVCMNSFAFTHTTIVLCCIWHTADGYSIGKDRERVCIQRILAVFLWSQHTQLLSGEKTQGSDRGRCVWRWNSVCVCVLNTCMFEHVCFIFHRACPSKPFLKERIPIHTFTGYYIIHFR